MFERECPLCGEPIEAFRTETLRKGMSSPPEYQERWNNDVRACRNLHDKSELIDHSWLKGLTRIMQGDTFKHPRIEEAKQVYGYAPNKV